jgi:hypothetical protein
LASRGSGDTLGKDEGLSAPGLQLVTRLNQLAPGTQSWANPYSAVGVFAWNWRQLVNGLGAGTKLSGLGLGAYHASAVDGSQALATKVTDEVGSRCGQTTKLVLVGYSQGAQLTADVFQRTLTAAQRKQIVAVVLFGDPYFNGGDRTVDRGSFSGRRDGLLGKRATFTPETTLVLSYCHSHDPICQGFFFRVGPTRTLDPGALTLRQHTNYTSFGEPQQAAATIAKLLRTSGPPSVSGWPTHRNDGQPAFFEYLGASFISPDWSSCSGSWCIVGSANTVYVFSLANGIAQVATIPLATADPATALAALGVPAATVAALLKP